MCDTWTSGHPSKYHPCATSLNFGDRTRTGVFNVLQTLAENGLMSFENPNYHLDPARLDDALNSNMDDEDPLFREIIRELESRCNITNSNKARFATGGYSDTLDTLGIDNRHLKR
ncbi:hypothetical protein WDU94_011917 [Cyamophila willieti]